MQEKEHLEALRELINLRIGLERTINLVRFFWLAHLAILAIFLFSNEPTFLTLVVNLLISLFLFSLKTQFTKVHSQVTMRAQMMLFTEREP